ncbi:MAG: sigma-54-dependent Fis family transcriptional regulator [Lewinellaceae bacterium]|nr:sigma-54-dependent Fis family transcriptional regulator [Saprospiraceae bacterium]MCB0544562.1 sigma-54-dependent Fis family transcriptional regulator [Saprospiraceae bacterium]MCB9305713.1 sigma-54-dependent Fis family transcriptional regulator [Lewinellaceae bacterium]MCB9354043.1 sigma-54-dependent Fis family transcriptional regulator [Lewinellaceae bacterium]
MAKILIVDDEMPIRRTLRDILEFEEYEVDEATDGLECVSKVQKEKFDVIIMDIKMPKMDGIEALERLQILAPEVPVIMVSGHGTIDTAVEAVKKGAFDFISKPPDLNRMLITVRNALERADLVNTTQILRKQVKSSKGVNMIGESAPILEIKRMLEKVAPTDSRVLITGQNGTGKELVARWIHEKSNRVDGPMVEVNCAAIPAELIESELFGHKKGSFTGAIADRPGKFEQANGGTLFLDEIGDMSLDAQAKVLRALQENKIVRVGDSKEIKVDVRVLAATNKDLREEIAGGRFREDLYHRLAVIVVSVPSLNERRDDIPLLVEHFNRRIADDYGHPPKTFTPEAVKALQEYNWTGNIRELANVIERLFILCDQTVSAEDVQLYVYPKQ